MTSAVSPEKKNRFSPSLILIVWKIDYTVRVTRHRGWHSEETTIGFDSGRCHTCVEFVVVLAPLSLNSNSEDIGHAWKPAKPDVASSLIV